MKLKKITALALAGALCMGMSVTAFAANSVSVDNAESYATSTYDKEDSKGTPVIIEKENLNTVTNKTVNEWKEDPDSLKQAIDAATKDDPNINLPNNAVYAVVDAADYVPDAKYDEIVEGFDGYDLTFNLDIANLEAKLNAGETLYLMHGIQNEKGVVTEWVLMEATPEQDGNGNWTATVHLNSLSPIVFVMGKEGSGDDTPTVPSEPTEPTNPSEPSNPNDGNDKITADQLADLIVSRLQKDANTTVIRTTTFGDKLLR